MDLTFKPMQTATAATIAQRLRVGAAVSSGVVLSPDEARTVASVLDGAIARAQEMVDRVDQIALARAQEIVADALAESTRALDAARAKQRADILAMARSIGLAVGLFALCVSIAAGLGG